MKRNATLHVGPARDVLQAMPAEFAQTCVCSPPYWGLRSYLDDEDPSKEDELGLEATPEEYVQNLVEVFREVRRVLNEDGTLWVVLGDTYSSGGAGPPSDSSTLSGNGHDGGGPKLGEIGTVDRRASWLPEKNLVGIPWRVALALQEDGWHLRSDIIWHKCLSGGTRVYARTQKGVNTTTIKDLAQLDPSTIELWNGEKWTQVNGISETERPENTTLLRLRSGQWIGCTPDHRWPLESGELKEASEIEEGDVLRSCELPEPEEVNTPNLLPDWLGWLIGFYLAEGSRDGRERIQIVTNIDENEYRSRLEDIAENLGGTYNAYPDDNVVNIRLHGKVVEAVIDTYILGHTADTKKLSQACWKRSDEFLECLLNGYLDGDAHNDEQHNRWRLTFTRNDRLADDIRTLCARLGHTLTLNKGTATGFGEEWKIYRGEIRKERSGHGNEKPRAEVVKVGNSRARDFYDIAVEDEPHLFALASGVLTHNSNPLPESVTDRPTSSHEHIFLLSKSKQYYYDAEAIREDAPPRGDCSGSFMREDPKGSDGEQPGKSFSSHRPGREDTKYGGSRNKRDVWTVSTKPYPEAHFAVYPPDLIEPCVKAGSAAGDTVLDPFSGAGTTGLVALAKGRDFVGIDISRDYCEMAAGRIRRDAPLCNNVEIEGDVPHAE